MLDEEDANKDESEPAKDAGVNDGDTASQGKPTLKKKKHKKMENKHS